jgi:Amidohydrolase family
MSGETHPAVAVRGPMIVGVSPDPSGLDSLAGPDTRVVDAGDLTVLPAFADAHEHLLEAARNSVLVPVERARSIPEMCELIAAAAAAAPPGGWILTSNAWNESNLAEGRPPTLAELDAAVPDQAVFARRGGHFAVANSEALRRAGIGADTADPPGGSIGHLAGRRACHVRPRRTARESSTQPACDGGSRRARPLTTGSRSDRARRHQAVRPGVGAQGQGAAWPPSPTVCSAGARARSGRPRGGRRRRG